MTRFRQLRLPLLLAGMVLWLWSVWSLQKRFEAGEEKRFHSGRYTGVYYFGGGSRENGCRPRQKKKVDCPRMFAGDRAYMRFVEALRRRDEEPEGCRLERLVGNCHRLRAAHGYDARPVGPEELRFPMAFGINMHAAPRQAERLLRAIYRPHNLYCVHVDRKADDSVFALIESLGKCFPNVIVVKNRVDVIPRSITRVKADLECMRECMGSATWWRYYINLTGQEFPLKTNREIVEILGEFHGANDVESYEPSKRTDGKFRGRNRFVNNRLVLTKERKQAPDPNLRLYRGNGYGMFTRNFVRLVLHDDVVRKFLAWLNDTREPEKVFWATVNSLPWTPGGYRHPFSSKRPSRTQASRAVVWGHDGHKCKGIMRNSRCVFGTQDLPWLVQRPEVIASKFDDTSDPVALDCLEDLLWRRSLDDRKDNLKMDYYRSLPHVQHHRRLSAVEKSADFLIKKKIIWLETRNEWKSNDSLIYI